MITLRSISLSRTIGKLVSNAAFLTFVAVLLLCAPPSMHSQIREPELLPGLVWQPNAQGVVPPAGLMLIPTQQPTPANPAPLITDFEIGWNWNSPSSEVNELLNARRYHIPDYRERVWLQTRILTTMVTALTRDHVPGQQLIPAVNGVSVAREWRNRNLTTGVVDQPGDPYGSRASTDPSESVAMEYQPWLMFNTGTNRFDLRDDDLTGGVFGFRFHDGGQVTHDQADNIYRVRYDREVGANPRVVLQDVQPNDQIRMWTPKDVNMVAPYYQNQNTRVMHLAVTLRRT